MPAPQTPEVLNRDFAIQDHLTFHRGNGNTNHDLIEARVVTPFSEATVLMHGAHLTRWHPTGDQPVIYLSPRSVFAPDKPVRGGIPVLYPWFGNGWDGKHQPMHGFARIAEWKVESSRLNPAGDVSLSLSLPATDELKAAGYGDCTVAIEFRIGRELTITLEVTNHGSAPVTFEEGLHSYFEVGGIAGVSLAGLQDTTYYDKRDNFAKKVQTERLLRYTRDVDQVHINTTSPLTLFDSLWDRRILITKGGSDTTVTWNPGAALSPTIADLPPDGYEHFVCVEAVNAGENRINLGPGKTQLMSCNVRVQHPV